MNDHYKAVIVGGGASGLFAGSILGKKAIVLEKGEKVGRKLLLTGGGRCNYTHSCSLDELFNHYNCSKHFIKPALYTLPPDRIISYFSSLGVRPSIENGKVFPVSGKSEDIVKTLEANCCILDNFNVEKISKKENLFYILANRKEITADYLLLSTGGNSFPHTGSDGFGYTLAKRFGHTVTPPTPALAPIVFQSAISKAEGISLSLEITINKKRYQGDTVITRNGISGPLAEDISFRLPNWEEISICFCPLDLKRLRKDSPKASVKNAINLPPRLIEALLPSLADRRIATLTKAEEKTIVDTLSSYKTIAKANAKGAMSTHGGIALDEINEKTMESKLVANLYFAGDILDVDANCGGYSLTWAFASANLAALDIIRKLSNEECFCARI